MHLRVFFHLVSIRVQTTRAGKELRISTHTYLGVLSSIQEQVFVQKAYLKSNATIPDGCLAKRNVIVALLAQESHKGSDTH